MKIIIGLGNPGDKYTYTRHNAGFLAIDHFLHGKETIHCQSKFKSAICEMHFHATKTFFVKPQTFMNNSGAAVKELAQFYKIDTAHDLLVLHDEIDLPFGTIRSTKSSSAAGHNGVQSIIDALDTKDFHRIRVGIEGRSSRAEIPTDQYVLSPFTKPEQEILTDTVFPGVDELIQKFIVD